MRKKSLLAMAVAAVFSLTPFAAYPQKGEKTLGLMGGFATYNSSGFTDVYFQYTFVDHVRIAPDLGYVFGNDGKSAFILNADMHFPFRVARGFSIYPLAGFTFNNWSYRHGDSESRAGANFGGGIDLYLTSNLKLTFQAKYSLMSDTGGGFFGAGIGYVF